MTIQQPSQLSKYFAVVISLLSDRGGFMEEIEQGVRLESKIIALLVSSSFFFAIYGCIIGAFHSWMQAISSAIKLPALYLMTMIICLPTLYFFNILFGSRKSFTQHFAWVLTAVSITAVLLFSLAPVTLFFLITARHYHFFQLLNVSIFALTGFVGVHLLYQGMQSMAKNDGDGQEARKTLLQSWLVLYAFVGSQLGWTLRPFFGSPTMPFQLFREMEGNFYLSVFRSLIEIFTY